MEEITTTFLDDHAKLFVDGNVRVLSIVPTITGMRSIA
jgi:hypothetical protein